MEIRNKRPYPVEIAATGQIVEAGGTVDVADDLGSALCEQEDNWTAAARGRKAADPAEEG